MFKWWRGKPVPGTQTEVNSTNSDPIGSAANSSPPASVSQHLPDSGNSAHNCQQSETDFDRLAQQARQNEHFQEELGIQKEAILKKKDQQITEGCRRIKELNDVLQLSQQERDRESKKARDKIQRLETDLATAKESITQLAVKESEIEHMKANLTQLRGHLEHFRNLSELYKDQLMKANDPMYAQQIQMSQINAKAEQSQELKPVGKHVQSESNLQFEV